MPSGKVVLAGVAAAGVLVVLIAAALDRRTLAFTLGVLRTGPAAIVEPGSQACQQPPIAVPERFTGVRFVVGTFEGPPQPLAVTVSRRGGGTQHTTVPARYSDNEGVLARLTEPVTPGAVIGVCIRNEGTAKVAIYGGGNLAYRRSDAAVDGQVVAADLALVFERDEPRSVLAQLPRMFERAALFRPEWIGAWTYWVLLVAVVAGVPLALLRALNATADD